MKNLVKRIPILRSVAKAVYFTFIAPLKSFHGSEQYWIQRYKTAGTSGTGSYHESAKFKAEILNRFVRDNQIGTIIEYGCGDGNQLSLSEYPSYIGFDVSPEAISQCQSIFCNDAAKTFRLMNEYENQTAQLTLSLDVIYHLVEDDVFHAYMQRLFDSSTRFAAIYSSNTDQQARLQAPHVKHRMFSTWIADNRREWQLKQHVPSIGLRTYDHQQGLPVGFYIYERA